MIGPSEVAVGPVRLVDITSSPDELRAARDNDTLAYIRRGETVNYNVSADKLKGGIPAERSNIRVRRPFWYSLNVPDPAAGRLVIPEHFDQRFVATALEQGEQAVVIDKLYVVEPFNADHQPVIAAALNSLLTWYQIELRGRTQLGEGVLEAKIPDLEGLLVLDPRGLSDPDAQRLAEAFGPVAARRVAIASEELEREDRELFDCSYLGLAGVDVGETEGARTLLSRELREAMSERRTRTQSVAELKAERTPRQRANRAVDAFAAQIVSDIPPYPDPRHFVSSEALTMPVSITPFEGALTIGSGLFDSGTLFAGSEAVAATEDGEAARFVRAVLTIDPEQTVVDIPTSEELRPALERWRSEVDAWWEEFVVARELVLQQIADDRLRESVARRALELSHASETPETPISEGVSSQVSSRRKARRKARRPPA